ncbi:MAG TPA: glycosyltransferase, partial [Polymorphobacter sp.]|nr:glycosyltransferase [Polymorphobacter sp.]
MTVSLIVCTRNRAAALGACLSAIAAIRTAAAWELVVVDNGSTDGTRAVIDALAAQVAFPVRAVTQPV